MGVLWGCVVLWCGAAGRLRVDGGVLFYFLLFLGEGYSFAFCFHGTYIFIYLADKGVGWENTRRCIWGSGQVMGGIIFLFV